MKVGAGGFGRIVMEYAIEQQYDVAFVDDGYDIGEEVCRTKIIGHIEDLPTLFHDYKNLIVAIGSNKFRESVYKKAKEIGFRVLQFNAVVKSNTTALALYKKLGFTQLGTIPGGFLNKDGVYEDIIVHYKEL